MMKQRVRLRARIWLVASAAGSLLLMTGVGSADDLGALARKEKERRAKLATPAKVMTEADAKAGTGTVTTLPGTAGSSEPGREPIGSQDDKKAIWKQNASNARLEVTRAEKAVQAAEREISAYMSDIAPPTAAEAQDPMRLQKREARLNEMKAQLQVKKAAVLAAKKALSDLEDDARKQGIPAGWLR